MAWVKKLPSGRWQALYRHEGREQSAGTYRLKTEARKAATEAEAANVGASRARFGRVSRDWLEQRRGKVSPETYSSNEMHLRVRINPILEDRAIRTLTPGDMDMLVSRLAEQGLAASTIKQTMSTVKQVLNYAVRNRIIPASPYVDVVVPKLPPQEERAFTRDELSAILKGTPQLQRDRFNVLLFTGMRRGELQALHRQDINFERMTISITRSFSNRGKRFKPTKGMNTRIVPMNDLVAGILRRAVDSPDFDDEPCLLYPYDDTPVPVSGLIYRARNGGPFDGQVFLRDVQSAARVAGIRGRVRLHDLRHTYATWLAENGMPLQDIQKLLGHTSVAVTERYAKYQIKDFSNVVAILDKGTPEEVASVAPEVWEGLPIGPDGEVAGPDEPDEDWHADYLRYGPDDAGPDTPD